MAAMFKRRDKPAPVVAGEAKMAFGQKTPEEMAALKRSAAEAVAEKKVLLERIRTGQVTLSDLFGEDFRHNERAQRLPVSTAVRALPGIGLTRANKILDEVGIAKGRTIRGVGSRQREKLLDLVK